MSRTSRFQFQFLIALIVASSSMMLGTAQETRAGETLVFDLEYAGPETSTVAEVISDSSFYGIPITGNIELTLDSLTPYLNNVNSDILLPPAFFYAISPNVWYNLDQLVGEYVATSPGSDVSMVFRPDANSNLRPYEIFVELTDGKQFLVLTGGIEQIAASPHEPSVRFDVHGEQLYPSDISRTVPEPATSVFVLFGTCLPLIVLRRSRWFGNTSI